MHVWLAHGLALATEKWLCVSEASSLCCFISPATQVYFPLGSYNWVTQPHVTPKSSTVHPSILHFLSHNLRIHVIEETLIDVDRKWCIYILWGRISSMIPSEHGKLGNAENSFALGETSVSPAPLTMWNLQYWRYHFLIMYCWSCPRWVVLIGFSSLPILHQFFQSHPQPVAANPTVTSLVLLSVLHPCGLNFFSYILTVGQYSLCWLILFFPGRKTVTSQATPPQCYLS